MHISLAKEMTSFSSHPNQCPETDPQSRSSAETRCNVQIAPSTSRCLVTSHIIWYGVGSCSLRFRRNPPTVRTAAANTTAVTARGTGELAAGAELSDSPLSWVLEARSVHKRANRVACIFWLSWLISKSVKQREIDIKCCNVDLIRK